MDWVIIAVSLVCTSVCRISAEKLPGFSVQEDELKRIVNQLRENDVNKAKRDQIVVAYQGHTTTNNKEDNANYKFFKKVDTALLKKPSYEKLVALFDNYERQTGIKEEETLQEKKEIDEFLNEAMSTRIWKVLYDFLHQKGHPYADNRKSFRKWITQIWFDKYSRSRGVPDSSGFEHVFVGEIKDGISGMHNWIRFYTLEQNQNEHFDYQGFLIKRYNVMAALKYIWKGELKRSGSFLIGTSPEFDMALYTLCFLSRRGRNVCKVELDGCPIEITSYDLIQQEKVYIGSIFPNAGAMTESCRLKNGK